MQDFRKLFASIKVKYNSYNVFRVFIIIIYSIVHKVTTFLDLTLRRPYK